MVATEGGQLLEGDKVPGRPADKCADATSEKEKLGNAAWIDSLWQKLQTIEERSTPEQANKRKKLDSTPESREAVFWFRSPNNNRFQPTPNLNRGKLLTECVRLQKENAKLIVENESLRADVEDLWERVKILTGADCLGDAVSPCR